MRSKSEPRLGFLTCCGAVAAARITGGVGCKVVNKEKKVWGNLWALWASGIGIDCCDITGCGFLFFLV